MFAFGVPEVWPVVVPSMIVDIALKDGALAIGCIPTGQIEAALFRLESGKLIPAHSVRSPVVRLSPSQPLVLAVAWKEGKIVHFELDKEDLLAAVDEVRLEFTRTELPVPDYAPRNEKARMNRYSVVLNLPSKPRRKEGGKEYMLASLRGEIEQMEDLIAAVRRGREAHVAGLASRLRLLVYGQPMGLLQHCAAFTKYPLIIYTNRIPETPPPIEGSIWIDGIAKAEPDHAYPCAVDLDVWLKFPAIRVGEHGFSHLEAIKDIGDTMGSHRDPGVPTTIQALQLIRTDNSVAYRGVQRYVLEAADTILALCRSVLSQTDDSVVDNAPKG